VRVRTISIIGCGLAGSSFAHLISHLEGYQLKAIFGRSVEKVKVLTDELSDVEVVSQIDRLPASDLILVAVNDSALAEVVEQMHCLGNLDQSVIFHISGSENSEVFLPLKKKVRGIASIHPLRSFPEIIKEAEGFEGTSCFLEGSEKSIEPVKDLFESLGAKVKIFKTSNKTGYHIASIFASNFLVALMDAAQEVIDSTELESERDSLVLICSQVLNNILDKGIDKSLTGPAQRGDLKTIQKQVEFLEGEKDLQSLYCLLTERALKIALREGSLEEIDALPICKLLAQKRCENKCLD